MQEQEKAALAQPPSELTAKETGTIAVGQREMVGDSERAWLWQCGMTQNLALLRLTSSSSRAATHASDYVVKCMRSLYRMARLLEQAATVKVLLIEGCIEC